MLGLIANLDDQYKFSPKIDGDSLKLTAAPSGMPMAKLNGDGITTGRAVYYDGSRLRDTGTTYSEVAYNAGVSAGTVQNSKTLVAGPSGDLAGLRNLTLTKALNAASVTATATIAAATLTASTSASLKDLTLVGRVQSDIVMLTGKALFHYTNGSFMSIAKGLSDKLEFGNIVQPITFVTQQNTQLLHKEGTNEHKVFTSGYMGTAAGLDAGTLNGVAGANFLRSDADDEVFGNLFMRNKYLSLSSEVSGNYTERYRLSLRTVSGVGTLFSVYDTVNSQSTFAVGSGKAFVLGNEVWHSGNGGAGSGMDADKIQGVGLSGLLQADNASTLKAQLTVDIAGSIQYTPIAGVPIAWESKLIGSDLSFTLNQPSGMTTPLSLDSNGAKVLGHKVWHEGNDGSNSGLDADKLDGAQASYFLDINNISGSEVIVTDKAFKINQENSRYSGKSAILPITFNVIGSGGSFVVKDFLGTWDADYRIQSFRFVGSIYSKNAAGLEVWSAVDLFLVKPLDEYPVATNVSMWFKFNTEGSVHRPVITFNGVYGFLSGHVYLNSY